MLDLIITNENNTYRVSYTTDNKVEAYKIFNILNEEVKEELGENTVYELTEEYKNVLHERYLKLKAKENEKANSKESNKNRKENNNTVSEDIIGDSEYDINTNRYIHKNNNNVNAIDYNICPLKPFQNSVWAVVSTVYLKTFYKVDRLPSGYKEAILKEWEKRGNDKNILLSQTNESVSFDKKSELTQKEEIELKKTEINKQIEAIKRGRDYLSLSDDELKKIAEIDIFDDTAKHILKGREFNKKREEEENRENEILKAYRENGVIQFGDEESKLDINKNYDPLSQNGHGWDEEGNKYMFIDEEESGFVFDID